MGISWQWKTRPALSEFAPRPILRSNKLQLFVQVTTPRRWNYTTRMMKCGTGCCRRLSCIEDVITRSLLRKSQGHFALLLTLLPGEQSGHTPSCINETSCSHHFKTPPSTATSWPVIYRLASDARKMQAPRMSSGSATVPFMISSFQLSRR